MRVTTFGVTNNYLSDLNNIMSTIQSDQQIASTGNQINEPSDNPVAYSADVATQTMIKDTQEWQGNAQSADSTMQTASDALDSLQTVLGNIRTQIVSAANGTNTASNSQQIAAVVQQDIGSVVSIANTNDGEQYIFAGTNGTQPPLSGSLTSANGFTWNGNDNPQYTYIGDNLKLQVNTNVGSVFNGGSSNIPLMTNLQNIYSDLTNGNTANLENDLGDLDANISNVSEVQADLGGRMDQAQSANTQLSQMLVTLQNQQSQIQDANMAQVISNMTQEQTVYSAALSTGEKLVLPTLADVLSS